MSDASKPAHKGSEGSFDVIHSAACGSNDRVLGSPSQGALHSNFLGILVNEILRENKSCVNECPDIKLAWEVGVMAEIFSSKPLDALPKVPASSLEPQFSEAQDLDQAKLEVSKPSEDAVYGSVAIAGLGRRRLLSEHSEFDVLCQRFELMSCARGLS